MSSASVRGPAQPRLAQGCRGWARLDARPQALPAGRRPTQSSLKQNRQKQRPAPSLPPHLNMLSSRVSGESDEDGCTALRAASRPATPCAAGPGHRVSGYGRPPAACTPCCGHPLVPPLPPDTNLRHEEARAAKVIGPVACRIARPQDACGAHRARQRLGERPNPVCSTRRARVVDGRAGARQRGSRCKASSAQPPSQNPRAPCSRTRHPCVRVVNVLQPLRGVEAAWG